MISLVYINIKRLSGRKCLKIIITEMACEISPLCDFLFGLIRTSLPMDTVDVELTAWMVKGIYMYRKDHTMKPTIFTPWNKKVIPSPLMHKIQAYKEDKRNETSLQQNNGHMFQFSAPPMTSRNPRKRTPGKIRARWLSKYRYNPMKARRPNTPQIKVADLDAIDMDNKVPSPVRVYNRFGLSCSFCKLGAPHLSPQNSDWSSEDWDGTKTEPKKETSETKLLLDWDLPKPKSEPDPTTDIDKLDIDKLHIELESPQEKQIEVINSLIPLPMSKEEKATMGETKEETTEGLTEVEKRYQLEEEKYALHKRVYVGQLSDKESDTKSDYSKYNHFD